MSRVKDPFSLTKLFNLLLEKFKHNNHVLNSNLKSETSTRMERWYVINKIGENSPQHQFEEHMALSVVITL
jgi:hypothetical protein